MQPAREEVEAGGTGALQTAGYCWGTAMAASLLSWLQGMLLPHG